MNPREAIDHLTAMHTPRTERRNSCCVQCGIAWPCPTRTVLDRVETIEQHAARLVRHLFDEEQQ